MQDMSRQRVTHKTWKRIILVHILINTFYMIKVLARLELEEILEIMSLTFGENNLVVAKDGPLNFMRGYLYCKNSYIINQRLYSPNINIQHYLAVKEESQAPNWDFYGIRIPYHDRPYYKPFINLIKYKNPPHGLNAFSIERYLYQLSNVFILMFSTLGKGVGIEFPTSNAFISAFRLDEFKDHQNHFLAALFLMAENLTVPMHIETVESTTYVVLKKGEKSEEHFRIELQDVLYTRQGVYGSSNRNKSLCEIVLFFVEYCNSTVINAFGLNADPMTENSFKNGAFLCSMKFLIQAYVFEFVDSVQQAEGFLRAVYEILNECSGIFGTGHETATQILNKCFIQPTNDYRNTIAEDYKNAKELVTILKKQVFPPFISFRWSKTIFSLPVIHREGTAYVHSFKNIFLNGNDASILKLILSLLYNPETDEYDISHIPNPTQKFKEFFRKYKKPKEFFTLRMYMDWNEVVSHLSGPNIIYQVPGNNLRCGFVNMLQAIREITGFSSVDTPRHRDFDKILTANKPYTKKQKSELFGYMEYLFTQISIYTPSIIKYSMFPANNNYCYKRVEYIGWADIILGSGLTRRTIMLSISKTKIFMGVKTPKPYISDEDDQKLVDMRNKYKHGNTFYSHLQYEYVKTISMLVKNPVEIFREEVAKFEITKLIRNNFVEYNRLLMLGNVISQNVITKVFIIFIVNLYPHIHHEQHPMIVFTSNLIPYTRLDENIREHITAVIELSGLSLFYPNFITNQNIDSFLFTTLNQCKIIYNEADTMRTPFELSKFICKKIKEKSSRDIISTEFMMIHQFYNILIFWRLFSDNLPNNAIKILEMVRYHNPYMGSLLSDIICGVWLIYMYRYMPRLTNCIDVLYTYIIAPRLPTNILNYIIVDGVPSECYKEILSMIHMQIKERAERREAIESLRQCRQ
ncbi:hypothetical protein NERG_02281 [Nematocida ausubeli]|uniref:Uncharacterized protein n=1 Tax=Nematocida ausubeli (strain ATCC PRA-371 / ERTm2) TaxID=1913371 RepID=H8ZFB0_NEMA1|nr:hypothetical protein NERG_02281 [Nematocida ausubeli]